MRAEAGFEKKMDCRVVVELLESGGVEIELKSAMTDMFGKQIKESAKEELAELGVKHAKVEIYDEGSLDFVIRARIKTAVGRARGE